MRGWDDCQKIRHKFPNLPVLLAFVLTAMVLHFLFVRRIKTVAIRKVLYLANFWIIIYVFHCSDHLCLVCLLSCLQLMSSLCELLALWIICYTSVSFLTTCPVSRCGPLTRVPRDARQWHWPASLLDDWIHWWNADLEHISEYILNGLSCLFYYRLLPNKHTCWQCSRLKIECEK